MEPLKIKLTYPELELIRGYCHEAEKMAHHPQAREELIVLAEFCPVIERKMVAAWRRDKHKNFTYALPVSIGRILHRRWQLLDPISPELRMILGGIDYALTQRNLKPDPVKPELF